MENPYASEWSRISGIASSVRQAQESVERLEEEARIMQEQAQSIPVERDENGNDINESLRESMRAQAQEAERQLQSARKDLKYAISSAHSLASRYRQQHHEYEEKARKTAKAGGDFGKLAGYRFGASTASEAQRLTNQREKHYRDHVKVLSSLVSAAERAAEGVEPTQNTSEIADRGTYQKTGSKAGQGRGVSKTANTGTKNSAISNSSTVPRPGKSDQSCERESNVQNVREFLNAVFQYGNESQQQFVVSLMASQELNSYLKDWGGEVFEGTDKSTLEPVPGERTIFTDVMDTGVRLVPRNGGFVPDYLGVAGIQEITLDDHIDPTKLKPKYMYIYNGNRYLTDRNGNIAFTDMTMNVVDFAQAIRKAHAEYRKTGGKYAFHSNMDAGHVMAIKNGQHPSFTMEQDRNTNRMGGAFRNFEIDMEKLSKNHKNVRIYGVYSQGDNSSGTHSPFWIYRAEADGKLLYEAVFTNDNTQTKR